MTTPDREQYLHGADEAEQERLESFAVLIGRSEFLPPLEPHHRILEVGCGTGALSRDVARRVPEGRVFGVDAQEAQLRTARQLADRDGIANLELRHGDAGSLPFADGELDGCYCRFVLEHLNDPLATVREMSRVVKPGGWVCALEWANDCFICHPPVPAVERAWAAIYELQARSGGEAEISRMPNDNYTCPATTTTPTHSNAHVRSSPLGSALPQQRRRAIAEHRCAGEEVDGRVQQAREGRIGGSEVWHGPEDRQQVHT